MAEKQKIKIGDRIKADLNGRLMELRIVESLRHNAGVECVPASSPLAQAILGGNCGETLQYQSSKGPLYCRIMEVVSK